MFKVIGLDDSVHACDCCGKTGLKSTVVVDVDGEIMHYGSVCATRHTSLTYGEIKQAITAGLDGRIAAAQKEFHSSAEYYAKQNAMCKARTLKLIGVAFRDFCRVEQTAANDKARQLAEKYQVQSHNID